MNFFYDEVMGEYITMTLSDDEGEDDYYNKEISMDELEGAVSRLKIDSAQHIFYYKFLSKVGKKDTYPNNGKTGTPNYNNPSSYRPISLTSIIGKLMERIITSRLEGYVETNDILDEEQEEF